MKVRLTLVAMFLMALSASAQTVAVGKYTTRQDLTAAFLANLRTIPNANFTLRSSDKAGGTIQAVRLLRNQELGSLFLLVTQQDANSVLIEATFTKNGGWFGGGNPEGWAKDYAEQLKLLLPDLTESSDPAASGMGTDSSSLERVVALRFREPIPLGITRRRTTIDSIEVSSWPKAEKIAKTDSNPDAKSKAVVVLTYSNRDSADWKCKYVITVLDDADLEIGTGEREVSFDEGEIGDSHRVGITMQTTNVGRAAKLRVQVLPQP